MIVKINFSCLVVLTVFFTSVCYGEKSPSPSSELLQSWESMRLGHWDEAEGKLAGLRKNADPELASQAWFATGNLWQFRTPGSDQHRAEESYRRVYTEYPKCTEAPWAMLAEARIPDLAVLAPKPEQAIPLYRNVMKTYPESDAAQEAALHLALALWQVKGTPGAEEGIRELRQWQADHPNDLYTAKFELLLGNLYRYPLVDYATSIEHLDRAVTLGIGSLPLQVSTSWALADLADNGLGRSDLAIPYYTTFLKKYPDQSNSFMAKEALMRLEKSESSEGKLTP